MRGQATPDRIRNQTLISAYATRKAVARLGVLFQINTDGAALPNNGTAQNVGKLYIHRSARTASIYQGLTQISF
jgi:hypothetical protein